MCKRFVRHALGLGVACALGLVGLMSLGRASAATCVEIVDLEDCVNSDGSVSCDCAVCSSHVLECGPVGGGGGGGNGGNFNEVCNNQADDDRDGQIDCADAECASAAACQEICNDGIDNDGNLKIDCADADCLLHATCQEICNNHVDDDEDGLVDCRDFYCRFSRECL